eukprot:5184321-Prymnesium_polylepis.1
MAFGSSLAGRKVEPGPRAITPWCDGGELHPREITPPLPPSQCQSIIPGRSPQNPENSAIRFKLDPSSKSFGFRFRTSRVITSDVVQP